MASSSRSDNARNADVMDFAGALRRSLHEPADQFCQNMNAAYGEDEVLIENASSRDMEENPVGNFDPNLTFVVAETLLYDGYSAPKNIEVNSAPKNVVNNSLNDCWLRFSNEFSKKKAFKQNDLKLMNLDVDFSANILSFEESDYVPVSNGWGFSLLGFFADSMPPKNLIEGIVCIAALLHNGKQLLMRFIPNNFL